MSPLQHETYHRPEEAIPIVEKNKIISTAVYNVTTYENKVYDEEEPADIESEPTSGMRSLTRQAIVGLMMYLGCIHGGVMIGYSNILLPQLNDSNSSLYADIETASSIAGVYTIAIPVGCLVGGFLMTYLGRKLTIQIGFVIFLPGWLIICFAQNHAMIFVGIIIDGFAKGLTAGAPIVLLDELADPKVRGIGCIIAIICLIMSFLVVESPIWLARNGKTIAAERALNWIWGPNRETEAKNDLDMILRIIRSEEKEKEESNSSNWRMIFTARVMKPFLIIHAFNLFQIICGTNLLIFFSLTIMQQIEGIQGVAEVDGMDSKLSTVLISTVRVIFMIVACVLLFLIGRRPLALTSGIGSSISALTLGVFLYIQTTSPMEFTGTSWVAIALVLSFVATNTIGFFVLPSVMMGEILPGKIRSLACGYIYAINDVGMCFTIKSFPSMSESLGAHGVFWMFGIASVACTLLVFLLVPETQGKSLEQIENYFAESNILWLTRRRNQSSPLVKRSTKVIS
ncbi:hypothetical protein L9F63_008151 [Diploptera punctata]|uniref:Major facilitator superfamily (MFS) profile domain-containing protein n=1 Tax=Diploptera punctata TaxID=6984 RepID=A0AAD8E286_DIPPU|nr:hypothetical protein L9F63_008151 [Diploptera punctata]